MAALRALYGLAFFAVATAALAAHPPLQPTAPVAKTTMTRLAGLAVLGGDVTNEPAPTEPVFEEPLSPVKFSEPLTTGGSVVQGRTLEELITGSPLFAPIEGLPAAQWEGKTCTTCHQWSRKDLCDQGKRYLDPAGAEALSKQHPYGGGFKHNVRSWASTGCE
jgi:hypothetical protein